MLNNKKYLIAIFAIILFEIFAYIIEPLIETNIKLITFIVIILLSSSCFVCYIIRKEKFKTKHIIYLFLIIGVLLRTMYIIYTPITQRQHDVYGIENEGHLGYIYKIYETGKLPETNNIQFYHPPLFHAIAAGWIKVNSIFNVPLERSLEGIQVITAIFSSLILLVAYKITEELDLKDKYKIIANLFMAVYPTFIILAGSINNDVLMILLQFLIILYLIKWDKEESIKNTCILALFTGLCVMTKISGAIMAVPILFVFIKKIVYVSKNNKNNIFNLFFKFLMFGIISLPLGLWHPVRNYILFNQPIGGVLIPGSSLYVGNHSLIQRFFSISFKQLFGELYCVIPGDYNVFSYIVKCSVFGEFYYENINFIATFLKELNLVLIILSIVLTIKYCLSKKDQQSFILDLLCVFWIINIISFYMFNIEYPYLCTMDFRYIVPSSFVGILIILNGIDSIKYPIIKESIKYIIYIFSMFCLLMFFMI